MSQTPIAESLKKTIMWAYILFGAGLVFPPAILFSVILAYVEKSKAQGTFGESHLALIRKVFWWNLIASVIMIILWIPTLGIIGLAYFGFMIWIIVKLVKGFLRFRDECEKIGVQPVAQGQANA